MRLRRVFWIPVVAVAGALACEHTLTLGVDPASTPQRIVITVSDLPSGRDSVQTLRSVALYRTGRPTDPSDTQEIWGLSRNLEAQHWHFGGPKSAPYRFVLGENPDSSWHVIGVMPKPLLWGCYLVLAIGGDWGGHGHLYLVVTQDGRVLKGREC
jgi:hypothetical protein